MKILAKLFEQYSGETVCEQEQLPLSGSNRTYYRIQGKTKTVIGVVGTSEQEGRAFCLLSHHFKEKNLNVPQVFAHSDDFLHYIQEDMGSVSLFDLLSNRDSDGNFSLETMQILRKTIEALPDFQFLGARQLDFSICFPQAEFDKRTIFWDLNYFKYNFLKAVGIDFNENLLEDDFERFSNKLLSVADGETFLYRDFQSRNVMVRNGEPFFIDFQGGRKGPVFYDLASFLWQAKANFSSAVRQELITLYLKKASSYQSFDTALFSKNLSLFVLFRTLQVLGAYGFRGFFERKPHFLQSIPFAIQNLKEILNSMEQSPFPYLFAILRKITELDIFIETASDSKKLTVKIYSFSYRKGIPDDLSGNGGGYVFDCRAIHNPGRYEPYKNLTGLDKEVIRFLEQDGEIIPFLEAVYKLADRHVERYLERGFSNLSFSFGCTGGQHRSVYSAQHLAEYLVKKFPVRVELHHREQKINQVLES